MKDTFFDTPFTMATDPKEVKIKTPTKFKGENIKVVPIAGGGTGIGKRADFQRGTNGTWLQLLRSCTLSPDLLSLISDGDWARESAPRCA